ncbi:MAG TPA: SDR family oxidoreductase [Acidimicrobiales bacterium]|nr:SDR family oxidoreductase [Acidimicrobiales bacterium]
MPGPAFVVSRCPDQGAAIAERLLADERPVALLADGFELAALDASLVDRLAGSAVLDADGGAGVEVDAALDALASAVGAPGAVVSVLGPGRSQSVLRADPAVFDRHLDATLGHAFRTAAWAARSMAPERTGRIVLVTSVIGVFGGAWETAHGAAAAGSIGLARSLAREVAPAGITVNVVDAGAVRTAHLEAMGATKAGARHLEEMARRSALGRLGEPAEVAEVVAWLASSDASYVTGAVVPVDGGLAMGFT